MNKGRIEAFSDGFFAIIITITAFDLKAPAAGVWDRSLAEALSAYLLSFTIVAIYWVNHHHLFQACRRVSGSTLWLNLHLLFWLSLVPLGTGWLVSGHFAAEPVEFYGFVLWSASVAYFLLARSLARLHGPRSPLATALGSDVKGRTSTAIYTLALGLGMWLPWLALALVVVVALMWLVPDTRIEARLLKARSGKP